MKHKTLFVLACAAGMLMSCGGGSSSSSSQASTTQQTSQGGTTSEASAEESAQDFSSVPAISVSEYEPEQSYESSADLHNDEYYDYDSIKVNKPTVDPVSDFAYGADLSAVAEVEANGGVYYNEQGVPEDVFKILARNGVNYCRLRLWNDPYSDKAVDASGKRLSYGGGGNDLSTDIYLAKRAKAAGMKILLDFHYSDHWADPAKFHTPKEWVGEFLEDMPTVLGEYTAGALKAFKNAGVEIDSVQIGNEENTGLAGFRFNEAAEGIGEMVKAGVSAAKSVFPNIKTLVHLTNIKSRKSVMNFLEQMQKSSVPYDIVGLSYYPFWHGEQTNLSWMMEYIKDTYNKPSWIVETSYGFTDDFTEWASNQYGSHLENAGGYLTSWQGQTTAIRDILNTIVSAKDNCGQGIFYWEPAWLPVRGSTWATGVGQYYNEHGSECPAYRNNYKYKKGNVAMYDNVIYICRENLEQAGEFDPTKWEEAYPEVSCRSAWANQGWFSFTGKVLPSAATYKYIKSGEKAALEVPLGIRDSEIEVTANLREGVHLPEKARIVTNFDALRTEEVVWDADELAQITVDGKYIVHGSVNNTYDIVANVIAQTNWVDDYSFENQAEGEQVAVRAPWEATSNIPSGARIEAKSEGNLDGDKYFHWYSATENTWELKQTLKDVNPGDYDLSVRMMAGDLKSDYKVLNMWYQIAGQERVDVSILDYVKGYGSPLAKYMVRPAIEHIILTEAKTDITIGLYCEQGAGAWGHADIWSFSSHQDIEPEQEYVSDGALLDGDFAAQTKYASLSDPWVVGKDDVGLEINDNEAMRKVADVYVHWWAASGGAFEFHQNIKNLVAGNYEFKMTILSADASYYDHFSMYYQVEGEEAVYMDVKSNFTGWNVDAETSTVEVITQVIVPEGKQIRVGFDVLCNNSCWGRMTDIALTQQHA